MVHIFQYKLWVCQKNPNRFHQVYQVQRTPTKHFWSEKLYICGNYGNNVWVVFVSHQKIRDPQMIKSQFFKKWDLKIFKLSIFGRKQVKSKNLSKETDAKKCVSEDSKKKHMEKWNCGTGDEGNRNHSTVRVYCQGVYRHSMDDVPLTVDWCSAWD